MVITFQQTKNKVAEKQVITDLWQQCSLTCNKSAISSTNQINNYDTEK